MKTNKKLFLIKIGCLLLFLVVVITYDVVNRKNIKNFNKDYFAKFNESFEGKIINVYNLYDIHKCLIEIELSKSSTDYYDVRKSEHTYYALIKDNRAEIINSVIYQEHPETGNKIKKGQYFIFDGKSDTAYLYQENILVEKWKPHISNHRNSKIHQKHKIN